MPDFQSTNEADGEDWVSIDIPVLDWESTYSKDPRVRLIPGTNNGTKVSVLVQRKNVSQIKPVQASLGFFF